MVSLYLCNQGNCKVKAYRRSTRKCRLSDF